MEPETPVSPDTPQMAEAEPKTDAYPEHLSKALLALVDELHAETEEGERERIATLREAHEFWKGNHYYTYDQEAGRFRMTSEGLAAKASRKDEAVFKYVFNFYRAYGLDLMAVISGQSLNVEIEPEDPEDQSDVSTAKACNLLAQLFENVNNIQEMSLKEGWCAFLDGSYALYCRYVVDGERWGYREEPILVPVEQKVTPDSFGCAGCGEQTPSEPMPAACAGCGGPIDPARFTPGQTAVVPEQQGTRQIPNGHVLVEVVPGMEQIRPLYAKDLKGFPFFTWRQEMHRAQVQEMHPSVAKKLDSSGSVGNDGQTDDQGRQARVSLSSGVTASQRSQLVTYQRTWLRPWVFRQVKNEQTRDELRQQYPKGVLVISADGIFCDARPECLDKFWRVVHPYPGDGQATPAIGQSFIDPQKVTNELSNIVVTTAAFGIPPTFVDDELLDTDAFADSKVKPAGIYPLSNVRAGQSVSASFHSPPPAVVSAQGEAFRQECAGPTGQHLLGAYPALVGGEMDSQKTATGYGMARDQASNRVGLVIRPMHWAHAELIPLMLEHYRENATADLYLSKKGPDGKYQKQVIALADLSGRVRAYPRSDSEFPVTALQRRNMLLTMLDRGNPLILGAVQDPENAEQMARNFGLGEIVIPAARARQQQLNEIAELLKGQPQQGQAQVNPMTGQMVPGPWVSTVPVDVELDDHQNHFRAGQVWMTSEAAQDAKTSNPASYQNVRLHLLEHQQAMQQAAMKQAMQQAAMSGGAPQGGPPQ